MLDVGMGVEIERKFLVRVLPEGERFVEMVQGYLSVDMERTVRVRIEGECGVLTIKGKTEGCSRAEFEYEIPVGEARELMGMCVGPVVEKVRRYVTVGGKMWEVDVFSGANEGLVVAEIELGSEGEEFEMPDWVGDEVTGDWRYTNSALSERPFGGW